MVSVTTASMMCRARRPGPGRAGWPGVLVRTARGTAVGRPVRWTPARVSWWRSRTGWPP